MVGQRRRAGGPRLSGIRLGAETADPCHHLTLVGDLVGVEAGMVVDFGAV